MEEEEAPDIDIYHCPNCEKTHGKSTCKYHDGHGCPVPAGAPLPTQAACRVGFQGLQPGLLLLVAAGILPGQPESSRATLYNPMASKLGDEGHTLSLWPEPGAWMK